VAGFGFQDTARWVGSRARGQWVDAEGVADRPAMVAGEVDL